MLQGKHEKRVAILAARFLCPLLKGGEIMNKSGKLNQKRSLIAAEMLESYKDFVSPIKLHKKLRKKHRVCIINGATSL